jgi:hypothetical protein
MQSGARPELSAYLRLCEIEIQPSEANLMADARANRHLDNADGPD